jgi:hypothetical protein
VIVVLRFIGVMNAAIWFGAAIFFTFGVAPTFFTPEFKGMLGAYGDAWAGIIAQMVLERFFILNYWCGALALAHMLAEWVYLGKAIQRVTLIILVGAFTVGLMGGLWLQPKLKNLHAVKYSVTGEYTDPQKLQAAKKFSFWHGISQIMNLAVMVGVGTYLWRMNYTSEGPRFVSAGKFRS